MAEIKLYEPTEEEVTEAKKNLCRINKLRAKKESLKSKRLGKKESEELRNLVNENCGFFMIFAWSPIAQKQVEDLFERAGIEYEKEKMPDSFNLKFF